MPESRAPVQVGERLLGLRQLEKPAHFRPAVAAEGPQRAVFAPRVSVMSGR